MNTETQYYYLDKGEVCGPMPAPYIHGLIRKLILPEDVQVCREGSQEWKAASEVPELIVRNASNDWQGVKELKEGVTAAVETMKSARGNGLDEPFVAVVMQVLACVVAFGGLVGFCVGIENDSATICLISLVSAGMWEVFIYSWSCPDVDL